MPNGHAPRTCDPWRPGSRFTRGNLLDMIEHPLAFVGRGQCVKTGGLTATLVGADGNHEPGRVILLGQPMARALLEYLESLPDRPEGRLFVLGTCAFPDRGLVVATVESCESRRRPEPESLLRVERTGQAIAVGGVDTSHHPLRFGIAFKDADIRAGDILDPVEET